MDFVRLTVFRTVARHLSFSKAAQELLLSQPAVSKHVQLLERELGVPVFHRLGRRVELTDAGRLLADYSQRVTVLTDEMRGVLRELQGLERGTLRVAASSTPGLYVLPPLLARFQKDHPGIALSFVVSNSADVARRVSAGECDLGFVGSRLPVPGIESLPFAEDVVVLVVSANHALARAGSRTPQLLAAETLVACDAGSGTRQAAETILVQHAVTPRRIIELSSCEAVKRTVAAGLGVAFASRRAVALEVAHGLLVEPDLPALSFKRQLSIIWRSEAHLSAGAAAFKALVLNNINVECAHAADCR